MTLLETVLAHNEQFVQSKQYERFQTTKFPNKKVVIVTCMDTRLLELLPFAMNIKNGDAKIIKNAGAVISHPFGSIMRSILVAIYELGADEVMVVGHHGCGMIGLTPASILEKAQDRGVNRETIEMLEFSGVDIQGFLTGFDKVEDNVKNSVHMITNHPLLPKDVTVHGLVICPDTGKLDIIIDGYQEAPETVAESEQV
ncbi:carbonic anhydrase [Alkalihalobacillus sp. MEB130]|uniref:beta-class carbonic anhydrase n=1 Tax=Alkalihalobacillus sp. MEB130 TaxID=2976704 RepID=UPI0028DFA067|nr:carbonic anhydrase [Alkalihalobacillus sp. MEB130]MDT8859322.1 carbonic anhydrase [Alkalihalobacillus sp. MEB130]